MSAKELWIEPIKSGLANRFVELHHYSGTHAVNACLNFGVFFNQKIHGVIQLGPSLAKHKLQGLVSGTQWHEFIELNRIAFDSTLPRNSESRSLSVVWRLMRKYAPQIKWVVSFADATQCGDGTIYRAAGFALTGITENKTMWKMPDGLVFADIGLRASSSLLRKRVGYELGETFGTFRKRVGVVKMPGFQLRYIYFLDPAYRARLTVPELPYSEIERRGASMYKGQVISRGTGETDSALDTNRETGGASPTVPLE